MKICSDLSVELVGLTKPKPFELRRKVPVIVPDEGPAPLRIDLFLARSTRPDLIRPFTASRKAG